MAAHFSEEAGQATIVCVLQQLEMWNVCVYWVPWQLMEEHRKNRMGVALNFLTQDKNGNDLLEWIITGIESRIHFYKPERKSVSMV